MMRSFFLIFQLFLVVLPVFATSHLALISVATDGSAANGDSGGWDSTTVPGEVDAGNLRVGDDGGVFFLSGATNLDGADQDAFRDVYVADAGTVAVLSGDLDKDADDAGVSESGGWLAVETEEEAFNLDAVFDEGISDIDSDVFLWDLGAGGVVFPSSYYDEDFSIYVGGSGDSREPRVCADGSRLVFASWADDLIAGDSGHEDIFLYTRATGALRRLSVPAGGAAANGDSFSPVIADSGRLVLFVTAADNFPGNGEADGQGVYAVLPDSGHPFKVSRFLGGAMHNGDADEPAASGDGAVVAYRSSDDGRVPGQALNGAGVFTFTLASGVTALESVTAGGETANGASADPALNGDGRFLVFRSKAANFPGANGFWQVYLRDRESGMLYLISRSDAGQAANADCYAPVISSSGQFVAFSSRASNLNAAANGAFFQVFLLDRGDDFLNHAPQAVTLDRSVVPGTSRNLDLSGSDSDGDALVYRVTSLPLHGTLELGGQTVAVGDAIEETAFPLVYTAASGYEGEDVFYYVADDGKETSAPAAVRLLVKNTADFPVMKRISQTAAGMGGDADSQAPQGYSFWLASSISDDGERVVFVSRATNLTNAPIPPASSDNVFYFQRSTGEMQLLSLAMNGEGANALSSAVSLSPDGHFAVFESQATDLIDTFNGEAERKNIYIRNLVNGHLDWVRLDADSGELLFPQLSVDGTRLFFVQNDSLHLYEGGAVPVFSTVRNFAISRDGTVVVFCSAATDLTSSDTNGQADIFAWYPDRDEIVPVSVTENGEMGDNRSYHPAVSANGRYVAFESWSDNLVADDENGVADIFVRDMLLGETVRVSVSDVGDEANGVSFFPAISANGQRVLFRSYASNLIAPGRDGATLPDGSVSHVFVYDRVAGKIQWLDRGQDGNADNTHNSYGGALSATGRFITFASDADNLVANDTAGKRDLFLADLGDPANQPPVAEDQTVETDEDTPLTVTLTATDPEADDLIFTVVAAPAHGTLSAWDTAVYPGHPRPTAIYTPALNFYGADSLSFSCRDGEFWSMATIQITVHEVNDPPVMTALADVPALKENSVLTVDLAATDPDTANPTNPDTLTFDLVSGPGEVTDGQYRYTPDYTVASHAQPTVTQAVTVEVRDNRGASDHTSFQITVQNVDRPPVVEQVQLGPDPATTLSDLTVSYQASDPDGDAVSSVFSWYRNGELQAAYTTAQLPAAATTRGEHWQARVQASAAGLNSDWVASPTLTILNSPPVMAEQTFSGNEDTPMAVPLVATDADHDALTFSVWTQPVNGTLAGTPPNLTYQPPPDFFGSVSFQAKVSDGAADSALVMIHLTVLPVPDPPTVEAVEPLVVFADSGTADLAWTQFSLADVDYPGGAPASAFELELLAIPDGVTVEDRQETALAVGDRVAVTDFPLSVIAAAPNDFVETVLSFRVRDRQDPAEMGVTMALPLTLGARRLGLSLSGGWNFISFPAQPLAEAAAILQAYPALVGDFWYWAADHGSWRKDRGRLTAGRGYWIYAREPVTIADFPAEPVPGAVAVFSGWNAVGPVGTQEQVAIPSEVSGGLVWRWQPEAARFSVAATLQRYGGYWVRVPGGISSLNLDGLP